MQCSFGAACKYEDVPLCKCTNRECGGVYPTAHHQCCSDHYSAAESSSICWCKHCCVKEYGFEPMTGKHSLDQVFFWLFVMIIEAV